MTAASSASGPTEVMLRAQRVLNELRKALPRPAPAPAPAPAPSLAHDLSSTSITKTIWRSPAGKKRMASMLIKLIPPHKTYVEPFVGSGGVYFAKARSPVEVVSDLDAEIADAFGVISTITDRELSWLKQQKWVGDEETWSTLRAATPKARTAKLYRFLYLSRFSFCGLRGKSFDRAATGTNPRTVKRLERYRDRLKGVIVRSGHYASVVKEFDGPDTFFFFDPPYPGYDVNVGEASFDEAEFRAILEKIRGKFLVTYGVRGRLNVDGFHVKKVRTPRSVAFIRGEYTNRIKSLTHLLISNYVLAQKAEDADPLVDVDALVDLPPEVGSDLDLARVVAKALAQDSREPSFHALSDALEALEGSAHERRRSLATVLVPLAARLAPVLGDTGDVTTAIRNAHPGLTALAGTTHTMPGGTPGRDAVAFALSKRMPIMKTVEERYVLGIVLEPETVDAQNDIYSAAEIRRTAHQFMEDFRNVGLMHQAKVNDQVKILESYLAPAGFVMDVNIVKQGTWLLGLRVLSDELWAQIKAGGLTGLSIGGSARREREQTI